MKTVLPIVCPVFLSYKSECEQFLQEQNEAYKRAVAGMVGEEVNVFTSFYYCQGQGDTPCYLGCPLFSRWFWEKAAGYVGWKAAKEQRRASRD